MKKINFFFHILFKVQRKQFVTTVILPKQPVYEKRLLIKKIYFEWNIQKIFIWLHRVDKKIHSIVLSRFSLLISADFLDTAISSENMSLLHYHNEIRCSLRNWLDWVSLILLSINHYSGDWGVAKLAFTVQNFWFFCSF